MRRLLGREARVRDLVAAHNPSAVRRARAAVVLDGAAAHLSARSTCLLTSWKTSNATQVPAAIVRRTRRMMLDSTMVFIGPTRPL